MTVTKTGNGTGTITSAPAGIACGATCSASFPHGTVLTLTGVPGTGAAWNGWLGSGGCSGSAPCQITVNSDTTIPVQFSLTSWTLTVTKSGNGTGGVSSAPAGIDCGATCINSFNYGTVVTLTGTPGTGSFWNGWLGSGGCNGFNSCQITVGQDTIVPVQFSLTTWTVTVTKTGNGTGSVTSTPAGIDCGATCANTFNYGTVVSLSGSPGSGSYWNGWSSPGCGGFGNCQFTVVSDTNLSVYFALVTHTLMVTKTGNGAGTVTSIPAGIDCGADCDNLFNHNTVVTLTGVPATGSSWLGWLGSGGCSGFAACPVTLASDSTVSAMFTLTQNPVLVVVTGAGTVTSTPAGINCGVVCSHYYDYQSTVTLFAAPTGGGIFDGWTGGVCSGTGSCPILVTNPDTVYAHFTP